MNLRNMSFLSKVKRYHVFDPAAQLTSFSSFWDAGSTLVQLPWKLVHETQAAAAATAVFSSNIWGKITQKRLTLWCAGISSSLERSRLFDTVQTLASQPLGSPQPPTRNSNTIRIAPGWETVQHTFLITKREQPLERTKTLPSNSRVHASTGPLALQYHAYCQCWHVWASEGPRGFEQRSRAAPFQRRPTHRSHAVQTGSRALQQVCSVYIRLFKRPKGRMSLVATLRPRSCQHFLIRTFLHLLQVLVASECALQFLEAFLPLPAAAAVSRTSRSMLSTKGKTQRGPCPTPMPAQAAAAAGRT